MALGANTQQKMAVLALLHDISPYCVLKEEVRNAVFSFPNKNLYDYDYNEFWTQDKINLLAYENW
jgi:hypothetical protein